MILEKRHECNEKIEKKMICNIEKSHGYWYLEFPIMHLSTIIRYCPYCGERLEEDIPNDEKSRCVVCRKTKTRKGICGECRKNHDTSYEEIKKELTKKRYL